MSDRKWFSFGRRLSDNGATEEPELKSANDNPWYCLATVHGEQPIGHLDQELAHKNRGAWNTWLNATEHQLTDLKMRFAQRTSLALPDPAASADFSDTRFDRPIDFSSFYFRMAASFRSAMFSRKVNFARATFESRPDFSSGTFCGEADFNWVRFPAGGDFQSATFAGYPSFNHAEFRESRANFSSVTFSSGADFASANFNNGADFSSATFSKAASFNAATFNMVSFSAAAFSAPVTFINTEFSGSTIFAAARFGALPPDLRGATMHEATEWHGVTWPTPPKNKADAQQQVYIYERLKQEMERLKKHEDEQKFFRRELRARRGLLRTLSGEWLLNLVYQWSSNYGLSFMRPLFWLCAVFAAGTAIFARAPLYCGAPMPIKLAAHLSFANIFVFLPDKREIMMNDKMVQCLSNTTQAVSAAQSLLSVVLLFLLGLALRNRFRMR